MYDPPVPRDEFYDKLLHIVLSHVENGDHVYDVGAARGLYTISLAVSGCSVYSFEPNPNSYSYLLENIRVNNLNSVKCFNIGLSDKDGTLTFYLTIPELESSFNSDILKSQSAKVIGTKEVEVHTIDKLVEEETIDPPEHIKIDVEGHGLYVLKGAEKTILGYRPMIYFEPHYYGNDRTNQRKRFLDFFEAMDYEVREYGYPWVCVPREDVSRIKAIEGLRT